MDNNWIKSYINKIEHKLDIIFIDFIFYISKRLEKFRYTLLLQSILSPLIYSLQKLNIGGTLIVNKFIIPNKMTYNLLLYIGTFFNEIYNIRTDNNIITGSVSMISIFIIFKHFKGIDKESLNKLIELNELMFKYDETGGYKYNITDKKTLEYFDIKEEKVDKNSNKYATKYITNILDVNYPVIEEEYRRYKELSRDYMLISIGNYTQRMTNFYQRNNKEVYDLICKTAKTQAIYIAKKYGFPLLDWVTEIPEDYIDKHLTTNFRKMPLTKFMELESIDIINFKESKTVKCDYCPELDKTKLVSEIAYQYITNNNFDNYKSIELYINRKYKDMNRMLQKKYNININGQYVSRAWIKFQEILHDTHLLDGFEDKEELKVFHICEAPGNFINSMDYYIKKKTNIKNYNWTAQSLSPDLTGLPDQYGFIKDTKDRWDMGPNKNGDILDEENMKYYIKKYSGVDFLISDCGASWVKNLPDNRNINIHQLFYALLIPGEGGGFVIKTFTMKYNTIILCLLYLACYIYGSVQLFKSNTNFWSYEIYIIGKHKKKITPEIENHIIKFLYNVVNLNKIYPIDELPNSFVENYESIIMQVVSYTSEMNKFLVFLANNEETWEKVKPLMDNLIKKKLEKWVKTYIL
jgi:23S rRNA U2552 (ribose-2'-O)-methylase RlmE/FtsJ